MKPSLLVVTVAQKHLPTFELAHHKPSPSPSYDSSTPVLFQRTSSFKPTPLSRPQARGDRVGTHVFYVLKMLRDGALRTLEDSGVSLCFVHGKVSLNH